MEIKIPNIHHQLYQEEVNRELENNFGEFVKHFYNFEVQWLNSAYKIFNDIEKYLILIHLVKKTFDFYSRHFVTLSFDQYFYKKKLETENFNTLDISKVLNIPKESVRRKILELEQSGVLKKLNKKLFINRNAYNFQKHNFLNSIRNISQLLSIFSKVLAKNKILNTSFTVNEIHTYIQNNFTFCWKIFFEMFIPLLVKWKNFHGSLETFFVFGTCVVNQHHEINKPISANKEIKSLNRKAYINKLLQVNKTGINAMSISEITGMPRTTVVRKLNQLVKKKILNKNNRKLYYISDKYIKELFDIQTTIIQNLSIFSTKIFNGMIV